MLFKNQILFLSFTLAVSSFLPSCESNLADDSQTESNYAQQQTVLPENEAQKAFARILSVAADKYPSVSIVKRMINLVMCFLILMIR